MRYNEDAIFSSIKSMSDFLTSQSSITIHQSRFYGDEVVVSSRAGSADSIINYNRVTEALTLQYAVWLDTLLSRNFHSSTLSSHKWRDVYACTTRLDVETLQEVMASIETWLTDVDNWEYHLEDGGNLSTVLKRYIQRRYDMRMFGDRGYILALITPFLERLEDGQMNDPLESWWSDLYQACVFIKRLPLVLDGLEEDALDKWIDIDLTLPDTHFTRFEETIISRWFSRAFPHGYADGIIRGTATGR